MKEFFDTSVLVAAFRAAHIHHSASVQRLSKADARRSACGVHSLAEFYSVTTSLPVRPIVLPEQAMLFLADIRTRLSLIVLTADDYFNAIQGLAANGIGGGRVYDALLLASAVKCEAETIYTWNVKHYRALAPHMSSRIQTPDMG
jgi:predicted nucleic acid-binding protein